MSEIGAVTKDGYRVQHALMVIGLSLPVRHMT